MDALRHVLTAVLLALVLRWLWKSSRIEKAREESGRKIFPPTRAIRIVMPLCAILFVAMVIFSLIFVREPRNWWVPYFFLAFALLPVLAYPPVLTIELDGVASRAWFGKAKKIRWEDIAVLHYNTINKQFTVRATDGRKITHGGYNADADFFRQEIQRRTRLPLKVARPGLVKMETVEVPYEDVAAE